MSQTNALDLLTPEHRRMALIGAANYAQADKSDPFAFNRAISHLKNGFAGFVFGKNGDRTSAMYSAESFKETRKLPDGTEFQVTSYKNVQRP